jgi:hypothetical protein
MAQAVRGIDTLNKFFMCLKKQQTESQKTTFRAGSGAAERAFSG